MSKLVKAERVRSKTEATQDTDEAAGLAGAAVVTREATIDEAVLDDIDTLIDNMDVNLDEAAQVRERNRQAEQDIDALIAEINAEELVNNFVQKGGQ